MISREIFRMMKGMVSMIFSKIHSRMICSHMKMRNERVGQFPPCSTEFLGLFSGWFPALIPISKARWERKELVSFLSVSWTRLNSRFHCEPDFALFPVTQYILSPSELRSVQQSSLMFAFGQMWNKYFAVCANSSVLCILVSKKLFVQLNICPGLTFVLVLLLNW